MRRRRLLLVALAGLALGLAGCGGGYATGTTTESRGGGSTLRGSVGPGSVISLDGTDGLAAGGYTIAVSDLSSAHNFHLTGPGGVDVSTSVDGEGDESFDVTLEAGEYTFLCDAHAGTMRGSFTVG